MALQVYDDSARRHEPLSLFNEIPTPPTFNVYERANRASFRDESVCFPFPIEDAKASLFTDSHETTKFQRSLAPMPVSVAADAGGGLRPAFQAFQCANGIGFRDSRTMKDPVVRRRALSPRLKAEDVDDQMARAVLAELESARVARRSLSVTQRVVGAVSGPHATQPSRRMAATLLLPVASTDAAGRPLGKLRLNLPSIVLLDAFAAIAQSTNATPTEGPPGRGGAAGAAAAATATVRFGVVVGHRDVSSFAAAVGLHEKAPFVNEDWKITPTVVYSFVSGSEKVHCAAPLPTGMTIVTLHEAVVMIQETARFVQNSSKNELCLPHGFVNIDYVSLPDLECVANSSVFLDFQAELQRRFKKLYYNDVHSEVDREVMQRLVEASRHRIEPSSATSLTEPTRHRFVRICPQSAGIADMRDPRHCIGVLLTSDDGELTNFMARSRENAPGPIYGLEVPMGEEGGDACVLFWTDAEVSIGSNLNLFFPRDRFDKPVTELSNSRAYAVQCFMWPLGRVIESNFFVLPCTVQSVMPDARRSESGTFDAFLKTMHSHVQQLRRLAETTARSSSATAFLDEYKLPETPQQSAQSAFFGALMGARVGAPCFTLHDAHALMIEHSAEERAEAAPWADFVAAAMDHGLDATTTIADAMSQMTAAFRELNADEGDAKRRKTPTPGDSPTQLPTFSDGRQQSIGSFSNMSSFSAADTVLPAPVPLARTDSLVRHLSDVNDFTVVMKLAKLTSFSPAWLGEEDELEIAWPLDEESVGTLQDAIWASFALCEGDRAAAWPHSAGALSAAGDRSMAEGVMRPIEHLLKEHAAVAAAQSLNPAAIEAFAYFEPVEREDGDVSPAIVFKFEAPSECPAGRLVPSTVAELAAVRPPGAKSLLLFVDAVGDDAAVVYPYRSF